jgi:hypothetical protein
MQSVALEYQQFPTLIQNAACLQLPHCIILCELIHGQKTSFSQNGNSVLISEAEPPSISSREHKSLKSSHIHIMALANCRSN